MEIVYFMTADEVKQIGYTNTNVEDSIISTTMRVVQDTMLKGILGGNFYKYLLNGIKTNILSDDDKVLIDNYIKPFLISAVDFRVTTHLLLEIRAKTVGTTNDQYYRSADEKQMLKLQDQLEADMKSYKHSLKCYLDEERKLYPEYDKWRCSCERPEGKDEGYNNVISFV